MFGAIIGGLASVAGSIFGSKKPQRTENSVDYQRMAREAEKAGFNPLTALRNGGSAGFSSSVHHPGLSGVGDALAGIGQSMGAALDKRFDPIEQKRNHVESALLDYQLAHLQAGPKAPMMYGDVPARSARPQVLQTVPPLTSQARVKNGTAVPKMAFTSGDAPTVSTVGLEDRTGFTSDPGTADAAGWEQRYGEPGDWIGGVYVMGADAIHNAKRALKYANEKTPSWVPTDQQIIDWAGGLWKGKPKKGGRVSPAGGGGW